MDNLKVSDSERLLGIYFLGFFHHLLGVAFVKKLFEDLDFTQPRPISRLFLNDPVDFGVSEADVPGIIKNEKLSKEVNIGLLWDPLRTTFD